MENNIFQEFARNREEYEIEQGKVVDVNCSNCKKELGEISVIRPRAQIKNKITVECPFCGDKSFEKTVDGQCCFVAAENLQMSDMDTKYDILEDNTMLTNMMIKTERV